MTVAVITATLLEIVDVTIVNVALPNIQGNLGVAVDQGAWVVTGYIIANVIVIPISPWLQIRFGRRAYYLSSILAFTAASLMCGLAGSFSALVFWRIIQGLAGGGLLSTSQSILRETYPLKEQGKASGIFSMGVIVGPTLGPLIGGIITDNLTWRWAFFVNIPVGLVAAALVFAFLRNPAEPRKQQMDWIGLGLLAAGLGAMQYVLDQGQSKDWFDDPSIVWSTIASVLGLIAFVVWTLRSKIPVVDLHVLKYRAVAAGSVLGGILGVSLYGSVVLLAQFVQTSLNFTATLSGELTLVRALAIGLVTPGIAIIAGRNLIDARIIIGTGFVLTGISNIMLAGVTTSDASFWTFAPALIVGGIGLGMLFVPLSIAVLSAVPASEVPKAAAFFNLSRQIGGSVATAILVTLLARGITAHQSALAGSISLSHPAIQNFVAANGGVHAPNVLQNLYALMLGQATVLSFADTSLWTGIISLVLAPMVLLMRRQRGAGAAMMAE